MLTTAQKKRIAILRGGTHKNNNFSMHSGADIFSLLNEYSGVVPIDIIVNRKGEWLQAGISKHPSDVLQTIDGVINTLQGDYGESGEVQRIIKRFNVPYFGSEPLPSALSLHKYLCKENLEFGNVKTPQHFRVTKNSQANIPQLVNHIMTTIEPSYLVKPTLGGFGQDISEISQPSELVNTLETLLGKYDDVLVEKYITGKMISCCVLKDFRNRSIYTTPATLVRYEENCYGCEVAEKITPAPLTSWQKDIIADFSKYVYSKLGMDDIAKVDFIITPKDEIYFLEVNSVPAMSRESLLFNALSSVGVGYDEFTTHLIQNF